MLMGRKNEARKSYVISVRLSDEEMDDFHLLMEQMQITKMSELMRKMLEIVTDHNSTA